METYTVTVYENCNRQWCQNGVLHRVDGPAVEYVNGDRSWYQNGKLHRTDGPAVEDADGDRVWYQNGKKHRVDGPAVEFANGTRWWYQNGQRHRTDGPAIEYVSGHKEWWIEGKQLTQEEFNKQTQKNICENCTVIIDGGGNQMTQQPEALRLADDVELNHKYCPVEVLHEAAAELRRLHAQRDALLEALRNVTVHLIAAHSLLHRGGKEAAASDAMFSMMLADYEKSFEVGRAAIKAVEGTK